MAEEDLKHIPSKVWAEIVRKIYEELLQHLDQAIKG